MNGNKYLSIIKMSLGTIYQWRVYCETDAKYEYVWSETPPTTCPVDPVGHTIRPQDTCEIARISPNVTQIQEELVETQGIYQFCGYKAVIPAGSPGAVTTIDHVWSDHSITLMNGTFDATSAQLGDVVNFVVAPNKIVGALTANASIGDTVLHVSPTVTQNIYVGFRVSLFNGPQMNALGICTAKDPVAGTITVKTAPTVNFAAASPSYIMINVDVIKNLQISSARTYEFARKKLGGKNIPAGTIIRILYTNTNGLEKEFTYSMELMY